jgi:heme-degrading monooxygenase HmoA
VSVIGVIVQFEYGDAFDRDRVETIAHGARERFEGLPGLRQKAFTVDETGRRATNVYLWESEDAARAFFDEATIERVGELYGVPPTVTYVDIAELVDNGPVEAGA